MNHAGIVHEATRWLLQHGYTLLAAAVLAEQLGVPVPAAPLLLAMGALAGLGHFHFLAALAWSAAASLAADLVWFDLGRRRGESILALLCRLSLEPDTCVRRTHTSFDRFGPASLLFCKFIPGLSTVAPPLAGSSGMSWRRFAALDLAGAGIWSGAYLAVGWIFQREIEGVFQRLSAWGLWFLVALTVPLVFYLGWKYWKRRRFLSQAAVERITPLELTGLLEDETPPVVIDLRAPRSIARSGRKIAGARVLPAGQLDVHLRDLPAGSHLVFYCS
jgi:membrane protein DedA with SNARE-associated domain